MPPLVLVVEDEPLVRGVTCRYLAEAGLRCLDAETGQEAIRLVERGAVPDLTVLDIRLPDMPGFAVALRIHQRHPQIPVLFVSGWVDGLADPHTLGDMRWEFLQKPFTGEQLVETAHRLLQRIEQPIEPQTGASHSEVQGRQPELGSAREVWRPPRS